MAPFRGIKSAMAEGGVRVAAFANHSSLHNPGRVSQTYLTMQDVMPTLLCQAIALGAAATGLGLNRFLGPRRWRKAEILLQRLPTTPAC